MSETIYRFAEKYRLRVRLDECRDPVILGRYGHIYEHSPTQLGVCIFNPAKKPFGTRLMRNKLRVLGQLGLVARQEGDSEGTLLIPADLASNSTCTAQILKTAGVKRIRKQTGTGRPFPKRVGP